MPQLNFTMPDVDLSSAVPLIALVILAALILITLTARTLLQSKALAVVAVAALIIGGSASIVGGLQALAVLIGVAGVAAIGLVISLNRSTDVIDLLHTVVKRDAPAVTVIQRDAQLPAPRTSAPQLDAPRTVAPRRAQPQATYRPIDLPRDWGF